MRRFQPIKNNRLRRFAGDVCANGAAAAVYPSAYRPASTKQKKPTSVCGLPVRYCWLALRLLYLLYGKALCIILSACMQMLLVGNSRRQTRFWPTFNRVSAARFFLPTLSAQSLRFKVISS